MLAKKCTGKSCNSLHYPGFAVVKIDGVAQRLYTRNALMFENIFVNTKDTLFSHAFLVHTCTLIHRCIISFKVKNRSQIIYQLSSISKY